MRAWVNKCLSVGVAVVMWLGVAALVGTSLVNLRIKRACCRCAESPEQRV